MADGKVTFEISTETRQALKNLKQLEKEYIKAGKEVDDLKNKLWDLEDANRASSSASSKAAEKVKIIQSELNNQLQKQKDLYDKLYEASGAAKVDKTKKLMESAKEEYDKLKAIERSIRDRLKGSEFSGVRKLEEFKQRPTTNAGLYKIRQNQLGVSDEDIQRYKAVQQELMVAIDKSTKGYSAMKDAVSEYEEAEKLVNSTTKESQAIEKQLLEVEKKIETLRQSMSSAREKVSEAKWQESEKETQAKIEIAEALQREKDAYLEAHRAKQLYDELLAKDKAEDTKKKILGVANALKKAAIAGIRFTKSITVDKLTNGFKNLAKKVQGFGKRLKFAIMQGLLLRPLRKYLMEFATSIGKAFEQNEQLSKSLANLRGTFWASIAPVIEALAPILAHFIDLIAKLITYLSGLVGILFGIGDASAEAGAAMAQAGEDGQKASKQLASWDTIQNLDSGKSGSDSGISPTFGQDFSEAYNALERFRELIEAGDWFDIGVYVGEQLNNLMLTLDTWLTTELYPKVQEGATNVAKFINGFFTGTDWELAGKTVADAINTITGAFNNFFAELDGKNVGESVGTFVNSLIENFDAEQFAEGLW